MKIIIDDFILKNKGWSFQETMDNADVKGEIEYHRFSNGVEPTRIYILPTFMALSEKYDKPYYNNKYTMILMPC
ncbi:hypothetical protein [Thalassobacillus sp. B23F22_16]|uniref:hypothetical protein n=1 Tax=Thalassobacillus sp. B23F22_16 TaxID=3459513 RepID=UPI00373EC4BB